MTTMTNLAADQPTVTMSRLYDAPRTQIWEAITEPRHVKQWWGGPGFSNPVCEMDVRPGGLWTHTMRFPDGREMHMKFVFVEVDPPKRLVWKHIDDDKMGEGVAVKMAVTLEESGTRTRWTMVAQFRSLAERDIAVGMGFTGPIEGSNNRLTDYLKTM
jgi:uncharacterized protein YndB with AHSA1/START domain